MLPSYLQFTQKRCANLTIFSVCHGVRYLKSLAVTPLCAPHFSELTWASLPTGGENKVTDNTLQDSTPFLPSPISLHFCEGSSLEKNLSFLKWLLWQP